MRIGLISDTHGKLRPAVFAAFDGVERILHAGDVGSLEILSELQAIAPVTAVFGNTDDWKVRARLKAEEELELEGSRIVVVHGHELGSPRPDGLREAYPAAEIIVYGHTHRPLQDRAGGSLVLNPGAAGPARFKLKPSIAILMLRAGEAPAVEFREL